MIASLTAADLQDCHLHPAVLECGSAPLLWELHEWPTLRVSDIAKRLLTAMFKLSHSRVRRVGKELVLQLRVWQLMQGRWTQPVADIAWWLHKEQHVQVGAASRKHRLHIAGISNSTASSSRASSSSNAKLSATDRKMIALAHEADKQLQQAQQEHATLSPQQQREVEAVALFQNPPVLDKGPGHTCRDRFYTCCWPIKKKSSLRYFGG